MLTAPGPSSQRPNHNSTGISRRTISNRLMPAIFAARPNSDSARLAGPADRPLFVSGAPIGLARCGAGSDGIAAGVNRHGLLRLVRAQPAVDDEAERPARHGNPGGDWGDHAGAEQRDQG